MAIKISHSWLALQCCSCVLLRFAGPNPGPILCTSRSTTGTRLEAYWDLCRDSTPNQFAPVCRCVSYLIDSILNSFRLISVSGFSVDNWSKSWLSVFPSKERERERELARSDGSYLAAIFFCICSLVKKAVPPSLGPRSVYNLSREMRLKVSRASFEHSVVSHVRASHLQFIQKWFASLSVCIWRRKLLWDTVASEKR